MDTTSEKAATVRCLNPSSPNSGNVSRATARQSAAVPPPSVGGARPSTSATTAAHAALSQSCTSLGRHSRWCRSAGHRGVEFECVGEERRKTSLARRAAVPTKREEQQRRVPKHARALGTPRRTCQNTPAAAPEQLPGGEAE